MMPAASNNKTEPKPSMEAGEPSKVVMGMLDKKVRNIEKRKTRLEHIKSKAEDGVTLEREQQETLKHYNNVLACLDFARDMQKSFGSQVADLEKQEKKRMKKEKAERAAGELKRTADILLVQATLDALGNDSVRDHFKTGKHGAVVLTDDNLDSLDELYKLITTPAAGEEDFAQKLNTAAEHLASLVEGKERPVLDTTYKKLWDLLQLIVNCGYFERARLAEEEEENAQETAEVTEAAVQEEEEVSSEVAPTTETFNDQQQQQIPSQSDVPAPSTTAPVSSTPDQEIEDPSLQHSQVLQSAATHEPAPSSNFAPSLPPMSSNPPPSLFPPSGVPAPSMEPPAVPATPQHPSSVVRQSRPLAEIVSQVEGNFSFLQESEIDLDLPHNIDPAVVAAQPMMRPPQPSHTHAQPPTAQQPPQAAMLPAGFPTPSPQQQPGGVDGGEVSADPLSLSQQSLGQASSLDYSGASQNFGQSGGLSHSQNLPSGVVLVGDAMFQPQAPSVEDPSPAAQQPSTQPPQQQQQTSQPQQAPHQQPPHSQQQTNQQQPPHGMMGPGSASAGGETGVTQYELPPSIPLPPSQQQQQDQASVANQMAAGQEKKFQLNASATEFQSRSMYSTHAQMPLMPHQHHMGGPQGGPHPPPHSHQPPHAQPPHPAGPQGGVNADFSSAPNFAQAAGDFSQGGGNFQGAGFQRGGRGGSPGYRGGPRGGGNRGGNAGGGGGNNMQNGFNNRPQNGNPRPTNRGGGAAFQGFPQRNDYRPDGFQGYNSNGFGGAAYQKRGGQGGPGYPRGGNNRGAGGMRGGGGMPRGGPPRGGAHNPRGGMGGRPGNQ